MRYHYSLISEDEPVIRDMPVYDATSLANGELLMLGTTDPDSNADQNLSYVTAVTASSAEAVDAIGILTEGTYAATAPSRVPATNASGPNFGKVIINPFAVYLAEYAQGTSDDLAVTSNSTTTLTITSLEDDIDGGWVLFVNGQTANNGSLRHLNTAASGSAVMDSALPITATSSDNIIKILPPNHRTTDLSSNGVTLGTAAAVGSGVSLMVADNYIRSKGTAFQPLRKISHAGRQMVDARVYADLVMLDHAYNNQ